MFYIFIVSSAICAGIMPMSISGIM